MRVLAVLLLLITAFMNLFAGLGYVAGGALLGGVVSTLTDTVGGMGQDLAAQAGIEITPGMLDELGKARDDGLAASGLILGYGAFLLVSVIVLLAGTMCLLRRTREKVIYTAGAFAILGEVGSLYLASFAIGIGNAIGLLAGLLALLAARGLTGGPVKVKGQVKGQAKSNAPTPAVRIDGERPAFGFVDALLVGVVGVGVLLLAGSGYLYYERELAGSMPMSNAVAATPAAMPATTPRPVPKPKPKVASDDATPAPAPAAHTAARTDGATASAGGSIRGTAFKVDRAEYENGVLTLRQGDEFFADASFQIFLFDQDDGLPEERRYLVDETTTGLPPHVHIGLKPEGKDAPETETHTSGYTMELSFGERDGITIPGRIRLDVPGDGPGSHVEGSFVAHIGGWVEILAPEDYVPDPSSDDFDTLKYIARAHLLETNAGRSVDVLSFRDTSYGTFGEHGGSGTVTLEFALDGGAKQSLEFKLEKNAQGWHVTETTEKS
ncbi:MAG: hypothetical protein R3286_15040 [Gammaproteobacteria bacterium]|nr:hypothetical protein [Gammaproteobacteria bacterium]